MNGSSSVSNDVRTYLLLRMFLFHSVLISTIFFQKFIQLTIGSNFSILYLLIFFSFLVSSLFIYLYEKAILIGYFLKSQIIYDIFFTSALLYYSGSSDSVYFLFFFVNIFFSAFLFKKQGFIFASIACSLSYVTVGLLLDLNIKGSLSNTLIALPAFFVIGFLSYKLFEELKKSRASIVNLEKLNDEIVKSLDSGLITINKKNEVIKINQVALDFLGLKYETDCLGKRIDQLEEKFKKEISHEILIVERSNKISRLLVNSVDLPDEHKMILFKDLTTILDLEEKLRKQERLASVGRLAAGIAHEIRNPLAAISGAAQIFLDESSNEEERIRLSKLVIREIERVDRLIQDLLRFAKPVGKEKEKIDLVLLVETAIEALKTRKDFIEQNVEIEYLHPKSIVIWAHKDDWLEVINNLMTNAVQAFSEIKNLTNKKIQIQILNKENRTVQLTVTDNGPGIPNEYINRIFDPFFTTKHNGTGLGLAQVYKLVREYDGTIEVFSEKDKGSKFTINFEAA